MGLFGALNTSVSGMNAQATKLSTIGDNIANSSTTGYKEATTEFETLLGDASAAGYESGGVLPQVRYGITSQGTITNTSEPTNLAINGSGFFIGQDNAGAQVLTRAGAFTTQQDGTLMNTAGYTLMGYSLANGGSQSGASTLVPINVGGAALTASPSTTGSLQVNLPSTAAAQTANLPNGGAAGSSYTDKTSLVAYDNLGTPITLDIYMTKTGPAAGASGNGTWEVDVFNHNGAAAGGGFPYSSGSQLSTQTVTFDQTTGDVLSGGTLTATIPNGRTISIDMTKTTQLASAFSVNAGTTIDGSSPATLKSVAIGDDGTVTQIYSNGIQKATYRVALGNVASPNLLTPISGNAYITNSSSGSLAVNPANTNGLGKIDSGALEGSTVDLATELTNMIAAQRGYEANSKVLQTASDLLGVINNIRAS